MNFKALFFTSAKFGVIASVFSIIGLTFFYYIGKHPLLFPPYLDFRIILFGIFIFFGLKEYKVYHNNNILHFWEGLIGSFILVTVFSILCSLYIYIFSMLEKDFVTSFITLFKAHVKTFSPEDIKQIGKENFDRNLEEMSATTGFDLARNYFIQSYLISLFISIILSVTLRQQPKN